MNATRTSSRTAGLSPPVRGFSLIEVLIALIIMSVGMLGIAGLYVHSMQAGRTSLFRHNAVTLAGDVADRIRANPRAAAAYEGAGEVAGSEGTCVASGANCTPEQMAAHDISLWKEQAVDTLPAGDVVVDHSEGSPAKYHVTVTWQEAGYEEDPSYAIAFPVFEM